MSERERLIQTMKALATTILISKGSGDYAGNHVMDLQIIEKNNDIYVRPIWSAHPDRDDGYYDIIITGDSPWGAIVDVIAKLNKVF